MSHNTSPLTPSATNRHPNPIAEQERVTGLRSLMGMHSSRRTLLAAAAAAGLIPILSIETVAARAAALAAAQDSKPVKGGTFVTLGHEDVDTLSPDNEGSTVGASVILQMFNSLYVVNENFEQEPALADSVEASADGKTYTFKLKSGVKFHNGDEFSSADVKYTYDWIRDPKNASLRAGAFELVSKVDAPDPTTIVVTLTAADVTFMVNVATTLIYPAKYHAEIGEDAFKGKPVGTGPFKVKEWIPAQSTTLVAFDDHFQGRANFDEWRIDVVPEAAGRMAALESGKADNSIWSLSAEDNTTLKESGDYTVYETLSTGVNHFPLNNRHPALSEKPVRQALMHALNRQSFVDDVYLGQGQIATSCLSPAVAKFHNPDVKKYDFNPDTAKKLLDDAGWVPGKDGVREKGGNKLAFTLWTIQGDTQRRPEAELAQQWWKDIGAEVKLQESNAVLNGLVDKNYDAGLFNWTYGGTGGDPDARDTLTTKGANNFTHFSNAEVDDLLTKGISEQDEAKRIEMYKRVQEIVAEEVPFMFLLFPVWASFYAKSIKGLPESILTWDALYLKTYTLWKE